MKPRKPNSFEGAIHRINGALTVEMAADATEKSASLVYAWGDPDNPCLPNLKQALALDAAYVLTTGEPGPVAVVYCELLSELVEEIEHQPADPLARIRDAVKEFGEAIAVYADAPHGRICARQKSEIQKEIREAREALERMERDVMADGPRIVNAPVDRPR